MLKQSGVKHLLSTLCSITLGSMQPFRKRGTKVQSSLQRTHLSYHWEASLNHHFAGRWWRTDTSTPHFKEEKNVSVGGCEILGDDGIGKKDLDSNLGSISQKHTGHLSPHASVLILDNPRKCVEAIWSRQASENTWGSIIKLYQWRLC